MRNNFDVALVVHEDIGGSADQAGGGARIGLAAGDARSGDRHAIAVLDIVVLLTQDALSLSGWVVTDRNTFFVVVGGEGGPVDASAVTVQVKRGLASDAILVGIVDVALWFSGY